MLIVPWKDITGEHNLCLTDIFPTGLLFTLHHGLSALESVGLPYAYICACTCMCMCVYIAAIVVTETVRRLV